MGVLKRPEGLFLMQTALISDSELTWDSAESPAARRLPSEVAS